MKSTAQGRVIYGNVLVVDNRAALDDLQGRPGQQGYHAEDWDIMQDAEGFHDPRDGTVVIFRDNVRVLEGETAAQALARVAVHERVGHHGFDALRESDSKFAEEWKKLAAAIPAEQMKELEGRYTHLNGSREALALEWFAHQVGNMEGRAQLEPGSVAQRMWQVRMPLVINATSYTIAIIVVTSAAAMSFLVVSRMLKRRCATGWCARYNRWEIRPRR